MRLDANGLIVLTGCWGVAGQGRIIVAGSEDGAASGDFLIARYDTDGSLDSTFGTGGLSRVDFGLDDIARTVVVDAQGRIVVGGEKLTDGNHGNYHWDLAVARLHGEPEGGVERHYVVQDANFNVTSLIGKDGVSWEVIERYLYDPYGERKVLNADWTVDTDGMSDFAFVHGHQGGRHDLAVGLVDFRNRHLDTSLGRWTRQDPLGYVDGGNLYAALEAAPVSVLDPSGLRTISGEIDGPLDALSHYYAGGGYPANLSPDMIRAFRRNRDYLAVVARIIGKAKRTLSCDNPGTDTFTLSDEERGISTGPFQEGYSEEARAYGALLWLSGKYWQEADENLHLSTLIGSVESLKLNATVTASVADKKEGECCCVITMSVKVHVKLRDRYGWDGGHNVAAENVLVKPTGFLIGSYRWNKGGQTGTPYDLTASWNFQVAQTFEKCE